ncbi:MAG: hypothetical protein H7X93_05860 [Sphingomonadaceae bacterium]|nr:hypothetical protein [Sphingomonadaceae bacterium]
MGTFFLHIGMHKTGTTAAQQLFAEQAELLRAQGLHYFSTRRPNHSFLLTTRYDPDRLDMTQPGVPAVFASLDRARHEKLWRRWGRFLDDVGASDEDALVSAEAAGLLPEDEIERLRDKVLTRFNRMIVLMLARPPLSYAQSAAQQRLKNRVSLPDSELKPPLPQYRARLLGYVGALGNENIRLEIFHHDRLVAGDPAQTLLKMIGKDRPELAELRSPRANESISMTAAKLLSALQTAREHPERLSEIPEPVLSALRALSPFYRFADIEAGALVGGFLPRRLVELIRTIPGDKFTLPLEIQRAVPALAGRDAGWLSKQLGANIEDFDVPVDDDAPTLADATRMEPDEIEPIVAHLADAPEQPGGA